MKNALSVLFFLAPPFGYMYRVAQQVSDGHEDSLPETQIIADFPRGVQILVAIFIYSIIPTLISGALQPASSYSPLSLDFAEIAKQSVVNLLIANPFILAMLVGFIRFITTDSYIQFFNLPKNVEYLIKHAPVILSYFIQAYLATLLLVVLARILIITFCGGLIALAWISFVWGYTIGVLARKLDLSWKSGKSQVTFGYR